jgi:hypothetical protein
MTPTELLEVYQMALMGIAGIVSAGFLIFALFKSY